MSCRRAIGDRRELTLSIHLYSCLDLLELVQNERVGLIAVGVVVGEHVEGLGLLALADKPTW